MKIPAVFKLIISVAVCEVAGVIGSFFTIPSISTWYAGLAKPAFAPPNWVFAPVWTTLFALMGLAAFIIWMKGTDRRNVRMALWIFTLQLVFNIVWTAIFFGLRNPGAAFVEILFLWLSILATAASFYKISKGAAYLLIPYILWVSFAAYLNFVIWIG